MQEPVKAVLEQRKKQLIITTGDTSDVDGFLALAEYSKVPGFQSDLTEPSRPVAAAINAPCLLADGRRRAVRDELPRIHWRVDRRHRIPHQPSRARLQVHLRAGMKEKL